MPASIARPILAATLLAGTLDIISAFVFAGMAGMDPGGVLRFVASGPFGDAVRDGGRAGRRPASPSIMRSWPAWRPPT